MKHSASNQFGATDGVEIGGRLVGSSHPVLIVAEAGVNHNGALETALQMVDAAADAGADAVKFQLFRATDLVTHDAAPASYQQAHCGSQRQREVLSRVELSVRHLELVKARCDQCRVLFLVTPFSPAEVAHAVQLGAAALKIASTDLTNTPLVEAAVETGLSLILSTGASTAEEITTNVRNLLVETSGARLGRDGPRGLKPAARSHDDGPRGLKPAARRIVLLHCVSCYPTPVASAHLRAIKALQRTFGVPCGYSDHTTSTRTGAWAVAAGACVLEKHFTLDKSAAGPDHAMSLSPAELTEYVRCAREVTTALGSDSFGMSSLEADVRAVARRSIVTSVDIAAGTELTPAMLTLKRPGTGLDPAQLTRVIGKTAAIDIPADTLLTWDMVQW